MDILTIKFNAMERMTFNHLFYIKKARLLKNGETPIFLRITANGIRAELSIHRTVQPDLWNQERQSSNGKSSDAEELNDYLKSLELRIYRHKQYLEEKNLPVTANAIKNMLSGTTKENAGIVELFSEHNQKCKELLGIDYAPATLTRYETTLKHLKEFIKQKYHVQDKSIKTVDYEFIREFEHYLKTKRKCGNNSTIKYIRNFRKIVREAIKNDLLQKDPFIHIKYSLDTVEREYLTHPELMLILKKDFDIDRLQHVKDIFIFSCFTGLAYAEVKTLTRDNIKIDMEGTKWIEIIRRKTGRSVRIPMPDMAVTLLDKYKNHPFCVTHSKLLPVLSNQKMNAYLKEIAEVCGIRKKITYHSARHTFASTVCLANGVPLEITQSNLGHSNPMMTQHYAKVGDPYKKSYLKVLNSKYSTSDKDKSSENLQFLGSGSK